MPTLPIVLIEILTRSGVALFISEQKTQAPTWLTTGFAVYQPWLSSAVRIKEYRSSQTSTANFDIQNLSGDTVMRDMARTFSMHELTGAIVSVRLWNVVEETEKKRFLGKMMEPADNGDTFACSLQGFDNWSMIKAPPFRIGETCGLDFGSVACGSTSSTPCNQSYGTCSAKERFQGVIIQWNGAPLDYKQIVQPAQSVQLNLQRPF
jgi:hypothetical protein